MARRGARNAAGHTRRALTIEHVKPNIKYKCIYIYFEHQNRFRHLPPT